MQDKDRCSIDGCDGLRVARGWCRKHYRRWYRGASLEDRARPERCSIEGCEAGPPFIRGWCDRHYRQWARSGDPLVTARDAGKALLPEHVRGVGWIPLSVKNGVPRAWAQVDPKDWEELRGWHWYVHVHPHTRYACRTEDGHEVAMHRQILGLKRGDRRQPDHWNHDGLDNRRENLRLATPSENQQNRKGAQTNSSTGVRGVSKGHGGQWRWSKQIDGKRHERRFPSFEAAKAFAEVVHENPALLDAPVEKVANSNSRSGVPNVAWVEHRKKWRWSKQVNGARQTRFFLSFEEAVEYAAQH